MSAATRDDRGSISAFAVTMTLALLLSAGLVFDGGRLVTARTTAADAAENAARAGAQELVSLRAGDFRLDPARAAQRAEAYLGQMGARGGAVASERTVTVTVSATTHLTMLGLLGLGSRTISVTRRVEAVDR